MSRPQFDKLDLKILSMLAANARKPYLEIARETGVSGAAVHQRIQRLSTTGVIDGWECLLNPATLGYETCAFVGIFLRDPSVYNDMVDKLRNIPEVAECYYTSGQYDIFIKVYAHDNAHLLSILQQIQQLGWARTETLISFKQMFKRQPPVPDADN